MKAAPIGRRFGDGCDLDGSVRSVGEGLHEGRVAAHAAVDPNRVDVDSGVGGGRIEQVRPTMGDTLEHCAHHVLTAGAPRQTQQGASGAVVPARCPQAHQCRDVDDAIGVGASAGNVVALGRIGDQAEVVAEPLDVGSRRQHDAFDAPGEAAVDRPERQGIGAGRMAMGAIGRGLVGAHVEHAAAAEGDLRPTRPNAPLPDQRRLLVAEQRRDGR